MVTACVAQMGIRPLRMEIVPTEATGSLPVVMETEHMAAMVTQHAPMEIAPTEATELLAGHMETGFGVIKVA